MNYKVAFVSGSLSGAVALGIVGGLFASPALALVGLAALNGAVCLLGKEDEKDSLKRTLDTLEGKLNREIERNNKLEDLWAKEHQELEKAKNVLRGMADKDNFQISEINNLQAKLRTSADELRIKTDELANAKGEVADLKGELNNINNNWDEILKEEVEKVYQERIKVVLDDNWNKHCELIERCMKEGEKYKEILLAYQELFEIQEEEALTELNRIRAKFTEMINDLNDRESDLLSSQETLFLKIDELKQEKTYLQGQLEACLNAEILSPEYGQYGFDQNGRITNAIAEWLWVNAQIPLKVGGYEVNDGVITAGYFYPRSLPPESLVKVFESQSSQMTRSLGLYAIEKAQKLQIADIVTIKIRRERPARKTDKGSLYRSKEEFVSYILSQPVRLRVVGEPGAGKTPTVTVLLSHILKRGFLNTNEPNGQKLSHCVVEFCNPLAGISVKNSTDLDFCLKWNSGIKGFKGLAEEYKYRKSGSNTEYKNKVGYIWISDEIDNTMAEATKDEAKPFKDALKDGGHVNVGVIVIGQSANVSTSKGLSIDDQKMMTNIYIDPVSIRTFLTQYGERFYSKKVVEKALATLEELELEIEEQNEIICDTAREFRIAMVTSNRSPVFYQLPYFDSVEINQIEYQQTLEKVTLLRGAAAQNRQLISTPDKLEALLDKDVASTVASAVATPTRIPCPKCAGNTKKNGKGILGTQKYLCKNPECKNSFTA
jgi:hypothetical protein